MAIAFLRYLGDFCHLSSIIILLYKIHTRKTAAGISLRTRVLYLFVFLARYGDLFLYYVSFYNTFMKILYLSTSGYIIYLMTISPTYKNTWYHDLDNFATLPLVIVSVVLAFICTARYTAFEISYTFSIILESVAILPQIDHLTKVPTLPALPLTHLVCLGLYRFFYVLNWLTRLFSDGIWDLIIFIFGTIQTIIWVDFFIVWYYRKQIKLPPNTVGNGSRSAEEGHAEGQTVDEGDMSRSLLLTHLISITRKFEERFMGGRRIPGLSVSAYPDQAVTTQSTDATYSDAINATSGQTDEHRYAIDHSTTTEQPGSSQHSNEDDDEGSLFEAATEAVTVHSSVPPLNLQDGFNVDSDDENPSRAA